jgi:hypothetical protein
MSMLPFPQVGYVTSVVPLDCWIQITTEAVTSTRRHCAVILIGNTNYKVRPGDIVWWNDDSRDLFWAPASETLQEAVELSKAGKRRRLWLVRIVNQQSYVV